MYIIELKSHNEKIHLHYDLDAESAKVEDKDSRSFVFLNRRVEAYADVMMYSKKS
jgi:hypothetical protein